MMDDYERITTMLSKPFDEVERHVSQNPFLEPPGVTLDAPLNFIPQNVQNSCLATHIFSNEPELNHLEWILLSISSYPDDQLERPPTHTVPSNLSDDKSAFNTLETSVLKSDYINSLRMESLPNKIKDRAMRILRERVCRSFTETETILKFGEKRLEKINHLYNTLSKSELQDSIDKWKVTLKSLMETFEQVEIPTIIWEEVGMIHYVNKSFRELTKFPMSLPTELMNFALAYIMAPTSVHRLMVSAIFNPVSDTSMIPCSMRDWTNREDDRYIDGTLCITVKRGVGGIPMLYVGNFLPEPNFVIDSTE